MDCIKYFIAIGSSKSPRTVLRPKSRSKKIFTKFTIKQEARQPDVGVESLIDQTLARDTILIRNRTLTRVISERNFRNKIFATVLYRPWEKFCRHKPTKKLSSTRSFIRSGNNFRKLSGSSIGCGSFVSLELLNWNTGDLFSKMSKSEFGSSILECEVTRMCGVRLRCFTKSTAYHILYLKWTLTTC